MIHFKTLTIILNKVVYTCTCIKLASSFSFIQSGLNWIHSHNPAYSTEILIGLQLCNQFKN